jgi:hypothetical protein
MQDANAATRRAAPALSRLSKKEARFPDPMSRQPIVLTRRPSRLVVLWWCPLRNDESFVLEPGKHRIKSPAGDLGRLHEFVSITAFTGIFKEHPEYTFQGIS